MAARNVTVNNVTSTAWNRTSVRAMAPNTTFVQPTMTSMSRKLSETMTMPTQNTTPPQSTIIQSATSSQSATSPQSATSSQSTTSSQSATSSIGSEHRECPDLRTETGNNDTVDVQEKFKRTGSSAQNVKVSTTQRTTWTVVKAQCPDAPGGQAAVYLQCQESGQWNGTVPLCTDVGEHDLSSFTLYFAVGGGTLCLIVFVMFTLYCCSLRARRKKSQTSSSSNSNTEADKNIYVDPYYVGDAFAKSSSTFAKPRAGSDIIYAKPVVYSTYLNPTFYEDAYDRWRRQEETVSEKLYESPWNVPRELKSQMETPGFKWSHSSLRTLEESGFRKLPRAHLSIDHASVTSKDIIGPDSTSQPRDSQSIQSAATKEHFRPALRRYPAMATRGSWHEELEDKTVTGVTQDDEMEISFAETDEESTIGLTSF